MQFADGEKEERKGEGVWYGGYAWRGSARSSDGRTIREVFELSPDKEISQGRWFLEQHPEIGGEEQRYLDTGPAGSSGFTKGAEDTDVRNQHNDPGNQSAYWSASQRPASGQQYKGYFNSERHKQPGSCPCFHFAWVFGGPSRRRLARRLGRKLLGLYDNYRVYPRLARTWLGKNRRCLRPQAICNNSRRSLIAMARTASRGPKTILRLAPFMPSGKSETTTTSTSLMINSS